jgi:hypothetical protein
MKAKRYNPTSANSASLFKPKSKRLPTEASGALARATEETAAQL